MAPDSRRAWRLLALALVLSPGAASGLPEAIPTATEPATAVRADLDLVVNGERKGAVLVLLLDGDAWVDPADLTRAGLVRFSGVRRELDGGQRVSLRSLAPPLAFAVDDRALELRLTAGPELFARRILDLRSSPRPPGLVARSDPSAFLDYALEARTAGRPLASFELGSSGGGWLAVSGISSTDSGAWARGLTSLTRDEPGALRRWTVGDTVAYAGPLGGGGLLGGLSVQRDFSLDPYALHAPLPRGTAVATSPSTLELYVNGTLVRRERLAPGTYDLQNLPVTSGAGVVRAVLRDAFGRTQELDSRYYYSSGILLEGQSDYGYHLGLVRDAPGTPGLGYGEPVLVARHRLGLSDRLTLGLRAEGVARRGSGGPGLAVAGAWGELDLDLAASAASGRGGAAGQLAWSYQRRRLSAGVRLVAQSPRYANTALLPGADRPLLAADALLGWGVHRLVTLETGLRLQEWRDTGRAASVTGRASVALGGGASAVLSASFGNQPGGGSGVEVMALLSWALGPRTTADVGTRRAPGTGAQGSIGAQQVLPRGDGFGYRVAGSGGEGQTSSSSALGQAQARFGFYEAEWDQEGRSGAGRARAAGGLVLMDGHLFASRPVDSSFALVQVPDVPGVRVTVENQEVGRTDGHGYLLVPDLLPWQANRIAIRGEDVPLDYDLGALEQLVAPPLRGGAVARFAVHRITAVTGLLSVRGSGGAVRPGNGEIAVEGETGESTSPVTPDGRFWLEGLAPGRHVARVTWGGGTCRAVLAVEPGAEPPIDLGEVACEARGPMQAAR